MKHLIDGLDVDIVSLGYLPLDDEGNDYLHGDVFELIMESDDKKIIGFTKDFYSALPTDIRHQIQNGGDSIKVIEKNFEEYSMVYLNYTYTSYKDDLLDKILTDFLGEDILIPYDIEDRKKKFPQAFKELEPYMRKYLKEK